MPLQKLQFRPGVNREGTNYSNEGGYYECDKIRFRSGFPEKIGGWLRLSANYFAGTCRTLWDWITLNGYNLVAVGTNQKYYVQSGGAYNDITPWAAGYTAGAVALGATPLATTSGSKIVTVTASGHGGTAGTFVTITTTASVGGLTISGEYQMVTVPDGNTFTIASPTAASSNATGGGTVTIRVLLAAGLATYVTGSGWGAGGWSRGGWGSAATVGVGQQLRLWTQDNYGDNLLLAPRGGDIYYWVRDTGFTTRAITLESAATTAGYDGTFVPNQTNQIVSSDVQRFTIAIGANPYDPTNASTTFDPMLVRWSDQENPFQWVPLSTNQAGEQRLATGSYLVTSLITRQEILIWSDAAIYSMQYLGPPYVWGFQLLMDNISIISPNAAVTVNNVTYWMGVDKFYSYTGRVETLPCTLRQYVFSDINVSQQQQIVCGSNEGYNEVWWFYPSANSDVNDRYVIYNHLERVWYYGTINRTAWLDSPLQTNPMGVYSVQSTFLNSSITATTTTIVVVDGTSFPNTGTLTIGSEDITYTGKTGNTFTGCTRGANNTTATSYTAYTPVSSGVNNSIILHENGLDNGDDDVPVAIDSYIQSSDFDIGDGHNYGFVTRMIPDVNFTSSTANQPYVNLTVKPRTFPGATYGYADSPAVVQTSTVPVSQYTNEVFTRLRGRQMSFRIESTDLGVAWQLGTPRIDIRPDGRKT
jgi:hypothetical protein